MLKFLPQAQSDLIAKYLPKLGVSIRCQLFNVDDSELLVGASESWVVVECSESRRILIGSMIAEGIV